VNGWSVAIGVTGVLGALVYLYVGHRLRHRPVPPRARLPSLEFVVWWWGLAADTAIVGVETIAWGFGSLTLALALALEVLLALAVCVALWGLVGYLTYLYRARYRLVEWSAFYTLVFAMVLLLLFSLDPVGLTGSAGAPTFVYAHYGPADTPALVLFVLALFVPEVIGIILYFSLIRKTSDRTIRFRIGFVTASLAIFFALDLVSLPASVIRPELWSLVRGVIEAGSSLLCLVAYFPPASLQRALKIQAVAGTEPERPA
jgi:hypothetical protein